MQHRLEVSNLHWIYELSWYRYSSIRTTTRKMKKKRSEETQTLCAGCSKAEPKIFAPPQTPFPARPQNISWRWSLYLYLQTQFGEDRCMQFRVIVVTDPHTHKHTHKQTGPNTIYCAAASAQYNYSFPRHSYRLFIDFLLTGLVRLWNSVEKVFCLLQFFSTFGFLNFIFHLFAFVVHLIFLRCKPSAI